MQQWEITRTLYKVSDFLSWQRNNLLELSPSFQRRPVWSPSAKSYLIDTIIRGLPIPIIFIRERTDTKTYEPLRQIVDGQQRIRTLLTYIDSSCVDDYIESRDYFTIKKSHNKELSGKEFKDLPPNIKQRIINYQFSVHILPSDVDDKQVLQIFARMNATGVRLNYQELRNAEYHGEFKQTIYDLSYEQLSRWRNWNLFTEHEIARMKEVEMVSDFILLMYKGISARTKTALDNLYKEYDEENQFSEKKIVVERFHSIMDTINDIFGRELKNSTFSKKTLFYILFAVIYDFQYSIGSELIKTQKKPLPNNILSKFREVDSLFEEDDVPDTVSDAASKGTTDVSNRKIIFGYLKEMMSR